MARRKPPSRIHADAASGPPPAPAVEIAEVARPDEAAIARIRAALLAWYDRERRSFPWRDAPSPYGTVVSEFMLQQTRTAAVAPRYESFLRRFPDFASLAGATEEEVLAEWSGLGYYRRARLLHETARATMERGELPNDPEGLRELPGFGDYTAAAVGSIALGLPMAAIDGNVRRVLARLLAIDAEGAEEARRLRVAADALLAPERPGDWNQAIMELGATVCTPASPRCPLCPLMGDCRARAGGAPEAYPRPRKAPAIRDVLETAVALVVGDRVLLLRRGETSAFAGMWELPRRDDRDTTPDALDPARVLLDRAGLRIEAARFDVVGTAESTFTNHRVRTRLAIARARTRGRVRLPGGTHVAHEWRLLDALDSIAASRAQKRLFEILRDALNANGDAGGSPPRGGRGGRGQRGDG